MTPTKKQIAEVTQEAKLLDFPVEMALATLSNCSLSIYKAIGAKGVVESSIRSSDRQAVGSDYIVYAYCGQLGNKNESELLSYNGVEFWVNKSEIVTINGITCFHKRNIQNQYN